MNVIFLLMGKTRSYKEFIKSYCAHNPALSCGTMYNMDKGKINVITGGVAEHTELYDKYQNLVHPVFIDTPGDQILSAGIVEVVGGSGTYQQICELYTSECKMYSNEYLKKIGAKIIKADNACDAAFEFMKYMKETVG